MTGHRGPSGNDLVLVSCWCEQAYRRVPEWWVWEGIAPECGDECWPTYAALVINDGRTPTAAQPVDTPSPPLTRWRR